ncbi:MAG: septation regulator SpoVG [Clostridia bacterium]
MKISDIKIRYIQKDGRLKGVASFIIDDCFVVHDIKIIDGAEGNFIAMPSRKTPDGEYKDIAHPLNSETRTMLSEAILSEFEKQKVEVREPFIPPAPEEAPAE